MLKRAWFLASALDKLVEVTAYFDAKTAKTAKGRKDALSHFEAALHENS